MKQYKAIKDRKLYNDNTTINWQIDDVFSLIKNIPTKKTLNQVDSVEILKEGEMISFIFSKKKFKKNFKHINNNEKEIQNE
jgi:hypothetical protein